MTPIKLNANEHQVVDTGLARYLRRALHCPDIMTWYSYRYNTWTVGSWISRSGSVVLQEAYVGDITKGSNCRRAISTVLSNRSSSTLHFLRELKAMTEEADYDNLQHRQHQADEHCALREFLRKRSRETQRDNPVWAMI